MLSLLSVKPVDLVNITLERDQRCLHVLVQLLVTDGRVLLERCDEVFTIGDCSDSKLGNNILPYAKSLNKDLYWGHLLLSITIRLVLSRCDIKCMKMCPCNG